MKNDKEIWKKLEQIKNAIDIVLWYPNSCAYTDSAIDYIIKKSKELEELQSENMELLKKGVS